MHENEHGEHCEQAKKVGQEIESSGEPESFKSLEN